jgi:hypothetical protein
MAPENDFALLVHACDRYEFLYPGFEYFFSRHWDFTIPCSYYFATEQKPATVKGFTNIMSGPGEWADRLRHLLTEKIKERYILFFQEDMWLTKDVNPNFFKQLFREVEANKWKLVKLHSSGVYKTIPTEIFIEGFNLAKLDNEESDYLMSHQVSIWDREFLAQQLKKGEHPWRNERRGTKRLRRMDPEIIQVDYFSENGSAEINENRNPIMRSGYNTISVNATLNHNIKPYIQELQSGSEEEKDYARQLLHHYENEITHDGKPKPRKLDIFQKLKENFRKTKPVLK